MTTQVIAILESGKVLGFTDQATAEAYLKELDLTAQILPVAQPPQHPHLGDALRLWKEHENDPDQEGQVFAGLLTLMPGNEGPSNAAMAALKTLLELTGTDEALLSDEQLADRIVRRHPAGNNIPAIKEIRSIRGCDLRRSKELIEAAQRRRAAHRG